VVLDQALGHAPVADPLRLANALRYCRLVPIHTEAADRYGEHFRNVQYQDDGERWEPAITVRGGATPFRLTHVDRSCCAVVALQPVSE
jgi:hypothetical protein